MSNPRAKSYRSKIKNAKQQPAQDGACNGKKRKRKPKKLWEAVDTSDGFCKGWVSYSAETREQVEAWIEKQGRSYGFARRSYGVRMKPNT